MMSCSRRKARTAARTQRLCCDFGAVVTLNISVALLSALVILPPLLVWADQRNWVSRGLVPGDILHAPAVSIADHQDVTIELPAGEVLPV